MKNVGIFAMLAAVSAMGLTVGSVYAADDKGYGKRGGGKAFERADTNGDGVVSAEEIAAAREARFDKMDVDGDGYLTEADREAAKAKHEAKRADRMEKRRAKREEHRAEIDTDGDGKISREEFMAAESGRLAQMDADGDGNITKEEAEAAKESFKKKRKAKRSE